MTRNSTFMLFGLLALLMAVTIACAAEKAPESSAAVRVETASDSSPAVATVVATPVSVAAPAAAVDSADWPGWRGPNRDGKSPDTGLLSEWPEEGPKLLWKATGLGKGWSGPAVVDGTVYITGEPNEELTLFTFDLEGKPGWKTVVDKGWTGDYPGSRATPTYDGGRLYLLSGNGLAVCLDAATGDKQWSRAASEFGGSPSKWGYAESILILDDLAIFKAGGKNCVVALDKLTGETRWQSEGYDAGAEYGSTLAFTWQGKTMIVTGTRAGLVSLDPKDGTVLWTDDWCADNVANCPTPAFADGYVFWANGYGKGGVCMKVNVAGDSVTAERAWTTSDMVCHHGGYIIQDGYIYGNNGNGWACLDLKTGEEQWAGRGVGKGSVCYADGQLFLFGERGGKAGLATCTTDDLEMKGQFSVEGEGPSWAHPVVIDGRLFLRYDDNFYCFDVRK